jgi:enterobactin synthetase component D
MIPLLPSPDVLRAPCISQVSGRLQQDEAAPELVRRTGVPRRLQGAVLSRQLEFLAGRWCARRALRALDPGRNHDVGIGADGAPRWPSGFVGSIAHTADFVWVAAALRRNVGAIGIDSEPIIATARARRLGSCIAVPGEIGRTRQMLGVDYAVATTLLFSAKESLFKCLYPLFGRSFDYLGTPVEFCAETATFRAQLQPPFCDELPDRRGVAGRFALDSTGAHTGVALSAGELPARFGRAQPLG